ncbi:hypothetical protein HDU67_010207 [Dinochytrium kinnereticum]|nr:hypothetical protein HDU67_010207 [Dinochytrium kinnereticum]
MCFIGAIAKLAIVFVAVKWFFKNKDQKRIEKMGRYGRGEKRHGLIVKIGDKETNVGDCIKDAIKNAAEWIKENEKKSSTTPTSSSSSSTVETLFTAPSNDLPAYTITDYTLTESSDKISIAVDVPGFKRDEVQVTVLDAEREILVRGSSNGAKPRKVDVKVVMPRTCDLTKLNANMSLGVLTLEVLKTEFEGRRVVVEASPERRGASPAAGDEGWEKGF